MNIFSNENPEILNKFLSYLLNIKYYSINTVNEYRRDLLVFFEFLKKYLNINVKVREFNSFILLRVNEDDIISFIVYLNNTRNYTASTRKRKIYSLKAFYKWLFAIYSIQKIQNPTKELPDMKQIQRLPKYLTLEKVKKLKNVFNLTNSRFHLRNNSIIILFIECGLRVSELVNINLCDLNLKEGYIKIIGKGNKERHCYLNENTKRQLKKYLQIRSKKEDIIDIKEPLFLSSRKGRLGVRAVQTITEQAYKLASLEDFGYSTHTLRHTCATIIYQYTNDILLVKEFLGHSTVTSTEIYSHVNNEQIKNAVESNPLSNFTIENIA